MLVIRSVTFSLGLAVGEPLPGGRPRRAAAVGVPAAWGAAVAGPDVPGRAPVCVDGIFRCGVDYRSSCGLVVSFRCSRGCSWSVIREHRRDQCLRHFAFV